MPHGWSATGPIVGASPDATMPGLVGVDVIDAEVREVVVAAQLAWVEVMRQVVGSGLG